jgi:hypothetical protein
VTEEVADAVTEEVAEEVTEEVTAELMKLGFKNSAANSHVQAP